MIKLVTIVMSKKSIFILFYLCFCFYLMMFFAGVFAQFLGYWVSGGGDIFNNLKAGFYKNFKLSFLGFFIGFVYWFFYYRKI